jgi:antitoxin component of MazEF toxin-antitoxin module
VTAGTAPATTGLTKTLTRHGNSLALIIDKPILDMLHIDADTPLTITTDGNCIVIAPAHDPKRQKKFTEALKKVNDDWGDVLKRLAK